MAGDFFLRVELEMDLQGRARIEPRTVAACEAHARERRRCARAPVAAEELFAIAGKSVSSVAGCKKGRAGAEVGIP